MMFINSNHIKSHFLYKYIFVPHKASWFFIGRFLGCYLLLSLSYFFYLSFFEDSPDWLTVVTGRIAEFCIEILSYQADLIPQSQSSTLELHINKVYLARIIEGCNGVSIWILFFSFVWAFSKKSKYLTLFLLLGSLSVLLINWLRIALLAIALYEFPHLAESLHQLVFPAIIYGWIILLWLLWVFKYAPR